MKKLMISMMAISMLAAVGCKNKTEEPVAQVSPLQQKVDSYAPFTLTTDLNVLTEDERALIPVFIQIADVMDDLYWDQYFGAENRSALDTLKDPAMKAFALIQYGAWDRLDSEKPFVTGYGERPAGANFYPKDMTKEEFAAWKEPLKESQYTMVRRDEKGALKAIPYHEYYADKLAKVDSLFGVAIAIAQNPQIRPGRQRKDGMLHRRHVVFRQGIQDVAIEEIRRVGVRQKTLRRCNDRTRHLPAFYRGFIDTQAT